MKTWRIRLVAPGRARVPPARALLRLLLAGVIVGGFLGGLVAAVRLGNPLLSLAVLAPSAFGIGWAFLDRDGQFLHDRLAGTRLELVPAAPGAADAGAAR